MSRPRTIALLAVVALLALTGCSTPEPTFDPESVAEVPVDVPADGEPAEESESIDVCAALAGIDLVALMGEEVGAATGGGGACQVKATSGMSAAALHVQVNEDGTRTYENQKALLTVTEELSSPGDEAFFGDTALAKGLDILVDGHHLSVRIHRQTSPITGAELVAVAETVLTNLGW
ncbi:hypothetical protein ACX3O0_11695 [Homoserinimonas sp. A447]